MVNHASVATQLEDACQMLEASLANASVEFRHVPGAQARFDRLRLDAKRVRVGVGKFRVTLRYIAQLTTLGPDGTPNWHLLQEISDVTEFEQRLRSEEKKALAREKLTKAR